MRQSGRGGVKFLLPRVGDLERGYSLAARRRRRSLAIPWKEEEEGGGGGRAATAAASWSISHSGGPVALGEI